MVSFSYEMVLTIFHIPVSVAVFSGWSSRNGTMAVRRPLNQGGVRGGLSGDALERVGAGLDSTFHDSLMTISNMVT